MDVNSAFFFFFTKVCLACLYQAETLLHELLKKSKNNASVRTGHGGKKLLCSL